MSPIDKNAAILPPPADYALLRGPIAPFVLRPYFDKVSLYLITRWMLPLSRAWAAAAAAQGSVDAFRADLGVAVDAGPDYAIDKILAHVASLRAAYESASARWEDSLFGAAAADPATATALEIERVKHSHRYMTARIRFRRLRRRLPPVRWQIAPEADVVARHGTRLDGATPFVPPGPVAVQQSGRACGAYGPEYWLRFPSPSRHMDDLAWAHVFEPEATRDPPTLIFLHGIMMEPELWKGMVDPMTDIAQRGVRVVRPEGPWHGRRTVDGYYGGEPAIGRGPIGLIELFEAWVSEVAALIQWARETSRGPVAIGGLSLGALTTQLAATAAAHWPAPMRPDAAFLVVTSGDLLATAYRGSLPTAVGLQREMAAAGWSETDLAKWLPLLQPGHPSAVAPERTVMLLGREDDVTPFQGGQGLAERWGVPPENLFIHPGGHFSAPLSQYRDKASVERLLEILTA